MAIGNIEEDTRRLHTRVNGTGTEWFITDKEATPLQLDDVTFL